MVEYDLDFMIGALPKSGTSLVSVAMNLDLWVFCFHDAIENGDPIEQYQDAASKFRYVGDSTTAGWLPSQEAVAKRNVFIFSDPEESRLRSEDFLCKNIDKEQWHRTAEHAEDWAEHVGALIVNREEVFTVAGLSKIFEHCTETPVCCDMEEKLRQLVKLRVSPFSNEYNISPTEAVALLA